MLRPAEDGSLVHVQHVRDLPSCKERRQWIGAHAAPVHFAAWLSGPAAAPSPSPLLDTKRVPWGFEVPPNAVLAPIFLATSDSIPGFRWALITAATCLRVSTGNTARISRSPVWWRLTLGIAQSLAKRAGPVAVDGELSAIEPFDVPVAAWDDGESFGVGLDPEPMRLGKPAEVLDGALLFR